MLKKISTIMNSFDKRMSRKTTKKIFKFFANGEAFDQFRKT